MKFQAMREENFLSSWLRKDVEGEEEERDRLNKEAKVGKERWRWKEKRVEMKRICLDRVQQGFRGPLSRFRGGEC